VVLLRISEFLKQREQQRAWEFANGFGNGDPNTNGEYLCFDYFLQTDLSLFLDVGANRGIFTKRSLEQYPDLPLRAFEPNPAIQEKLQSVIATGSKAKAFQLALDEFAGQDVSFFVHQKHHETSSLSPRKLMTSRFQDDMYEITVPVETLDGVLSAESVDLTNVFLKIDTEGHEAGVMRGAKSVLEQAQQAAILFEYSFAWVESGQSIEDNFQFLNNLGFDFYRVLPVGLEHLRFITRDMSNIQYCNYMAVKGHSFENCEQVSVASPLGTNQLILL
jgi:FkbM family methyltransferase